MLEPVVMALLAASAGPLLPEVASGWRAEAPATRYDTATIFDYIDGHGEVYLAYGMRSCTARRYLGPPGENGILLDVFDMGSPEDAYGVFSHAREGEPVEAGEEGSFGAGTLAFWKGRFFVSVTAERVTALSRPAVLALGRTVAATITDRGTRPVLVSRLPRNGLDERSVVYLRHPIILAAHAQLGEGNVLGVGPGVPAVLGRYRRGEGSAQLLVVRYGTEGASSTARGAFAAAFLEGGKVTRRKDGWWGSARVPGTAPASAFVVRAGTEALAVSLLAEATKGGAP